MRYLVTAKVRPGKEKALLKAIEPWRADPAIKWEEAEPTLEDIFIHLMGKARDNAEG